MKDQIVQNGLSFDVEDYFQVTALAGAVSRDSWDQQRPRVESNTNRLLDMLSRHNIRGTFFVLGWIAERHPSIVRDIVTAGHEIACHGYSHELVYRQTRDEFRNETSRARRIIEDQAQTKIRGYRAASWSITSDTLWALDILHEEGFEYDSSIFPTHHDFYGIPDAPRFPYRIKLPAGGSLLEFPPSTLKLGPFNLPVAGGAYFRFLPLAVTCWSIKRVNREGLPFLYYLHPWEIDPDQPRFKVGAKSRIRHYTNIDTCESKLEALLREFPMGPLIDVLRAPAIPEVVLGTHSPLVLAQGAASST
jgi:polysaccharide deacetylase family protein (PEP-CTERM system associated)